MESARKFKIIVNSKECGTCSGSSPSAVAKKVVKKLCGKSKKMVKFSLKECKRGCERECGPYQGRMEKLDKPCKRGGKTITHRVVCGKVRKMKGGENREMNVYKRNLTVEDFVKPSNLRDNYEIKNIARIPYLFLVGLQTENSSNNSSYFKFAIGQNIVLIYKSGKITEYHIDESNIHEFEMHKLFELLNQNQVFNGKNNSRIIDILKQQYNPSLINIIKDLENLHLLYYKFKKYPFFRINQNGLYLFKNKFENVPIYTFFFDNPNQIIISGITKLIDINDELNIEVFNKFGLFELLENIGWIDDSNNKGLFIDNKLIDILKENYKKLTNIINDLEKLKELSKK